MTQNQKTNRIQTKDLAVSEQELSGKEMEQVQGGASNLNSSKSNLPPMPGATTAATPGAIISPPLSPGEAGKAAPPKPTQQK